MQPFVVVHHMRLATDPSNPILAGTHYRHFAILCQCYVVVADVAAAAAAEDDDAYACLYIFKRFHCYRHWQQQQQIKRIRNI